MLRAQYCNNPGDWREVSESGYAQAAFKGWAVEPAAEFIKTDEGERLVLVTSRKVAGESWILISDEGGEMDWFLAETVLAKPIYNFEGERINADAK